MKWVCVSISEATVKKGHHAPTDGEGGAVGNAGSPAEWCGDEGRVPYLWLTPLDWASGREKIGIWKLRIDWNRKHPEPEDAMRKIGKENVDGGCIFLRLSFPSWFSYCLLPLPRCSGRSVVLKKICWPESVRKVSSSLMWSGFWNIL